MNHIHRFPCRLTMLIFFPSRLRKTKCVQTAARDQCRACEMNDLSCEFRDRERYFAERGRSIIRGMRAYPGPSPYPTTGGRNVRRQAAAQRSPHGRRLPHAMVDILETRTRLSPAADHLRGTPAPCADIAPISPPQFNDGPLISGGLFVEGAGSSRLVGLPP